MTPPRGRVAALAVAASAGHVLYPAWLAAVTRRRPAPEPPPAPAQWPPVSVVVAAHKEVGVIADKVRGLRDNGYRGEVEVVVVADGDPETAAAAEAAGARVLSPPARLGKAPALNLGVAAASHALIVLTDANNELAPGALEALVRWFEDPEVAAVAGEKLEGDDGGESVYWRFESWLKQREARLGTTIGIVGELSALRAELWPPIPADVGIDDLWLAVALAAGHHTIRYEPAARAYDPPVGSLKLQWERRTRSVASALHLFRRRPDVLGPATGAVAVEFWGHRLWRYTGGPIAHLSLLLMAVRTARRSRLARLTLAAHLVGVVGIVGEARGKRLPMPFVVGGQVLFLQAVAIGGVVRHLYGTSSPMWRKVSR